MRTESKKSFKHGFVLTEQELRRTVDTVLEQLRQGTEDAVETRFEMKYQNGSLSYPQSLDDMFAEENAGSSLITRVKISCTIGVQEPLRNVEIEFINVDVEEEDDEKSIKYYIVGEERDWVFVLSSKLDERVSKIKDFWLTRLFASKESKKLFTQFAPPTFALGVFAGMFFWFIPSVRETRLAAIQEVKTAWRSGDISEPVEVFFRIAEVREKLNDPGEGIEFLLIPILVAIVVLLLVFFLYRLIKYFWPMYNFVWGDYKDLHIQRNSRGKIVFGAIIGAFILSIVASYSANLLPPLW